MVQQENSTGFVASTLVSNMGGNESSAGIGSIAEFRKSGGWRKSRDARRSAKTRCGKGLVLRESQWRNLHADMLADLTDRTCCADMINGLALASTPVDPSRLPFPASERIQNRLQAEVTLRAVQMQR